MNKTKMPHVDFTWNPFTGCTHGCKWCYARAVYNRFGKCFSPATHENRLHQPKRVTKPSVIFCGSAGDIADCPPEFAAKVLDVMRKTPQHQYLMLTKRPFDTHSTLGTFSQPDNLWMGISVTDNEKLHEHITELSNIFFPSTKRAVLSAEPLLGELTDLDHALSFGKEQLLSPWIEWIIVGGKSLGKPLHDPKRYDGGKMWLTQICDCAKKHNIPILYKHGGSEIPDVFEVFSGRTYKDNPIRDAVNAIELCTK